MSLIANVIFTIFYNRYTEIFDGASYISLCYKLGIAKGIEEMIHPKKLDFPELSRNNFEEWWETQEEAKDKIALLYRIYNENPTIVYMSFGEFSTMNEKYDITTDIGQFNRMSVCRNNKEYISIKSYLIYVFIMLYSYSTPRLSR